MAKVLYLQQKKNGKAKIIKIKSLWIIVPNIEKIF